MAHVRERNATIAPVTVSAPSELVALGETEMQASYIFSWLLISLTLAIATLFVSNILGRLVADAGVKFATLRAIGVSSRNVLRTFAGEAAVVTCFAWVLGIVMASGLGAGMNVVIEEAYGIENMLTSDPPLFVASFLIAVVLGMAAGLVPARQATAIDPVEVLRNA
jgi:putative ABC transport system permease protein